MTSEFQIDRPGTYRRGDGKDVYLWPSLTLSELRWVQLCSDWPMAYLDDGRYLRLGHDEPALMIVAYVGPLPAEILQRMQDALKQAEEAPQR